MRDELSFEPPEMVDELQNIGVNFSELAREIGEDPLCFAYLRTGRIKTFPYALLFQTLKDKREKISRVSVNQRNFEKLLRDLNIKESYIAKRLGITRQALNEAKHKGFSQERLNRIEDILKEVAEVLTSLLRTA